MRVEWTPTEDARMKAEFPTIGAPKMAARLGKSVWSTRKRAKQLGLKYQKPTRWTDTKIKQIARDYRSLGGPATALKYGITTSTIRYLLSKANIHNPKWYWTPEEDVIVIAMYLSAPYSKILAKLPGRSIVAIRSRASILGVRRPNNTWRNKV